MREHPAVKVFAAEFDKPMRAQNQVYACCRKVIAIVLEELSLEKLAHEPIKDRVRIARHSVDYELPGQLDTHRCCYGHFMDLCLDIPEYINKLGAPAQ